MNRKYNSHKTSDISNKANIGNGTQIWHQAQIRDGVLIGRNCIVGKGVYIDKDVTIGNNVKIQNYASIYNEALVEDGVFIGPQVNLLNDKLPRAINKEGIIKKETDWVKGRIVVRKGASLGAGSIILPNVTIGEYAMIGAGSVVSKDVRSHALVFGMPAKVKGFVCMCGNVISRGSKMPKRLTCNNH